MPIHNQLPKPVNLATLSFHNKSNRLNNRFCGRGGFIGEEISSDTRVEFICCRCCCHWTSWEEVSRRSSWVGRSSSAVVSPRPRVVVSLRPAPATSAHSLSPATWLKQQRKTLYQSQWITKLVLFGPTPSCILMAPSHGWNQFVLFTLCSLIWNRETNC